MDDRTDPQRRQVLALMGALGVGALANQAWPGVARAASPGALGAAIRDAAARPLLPANAIDVHAHFFNASDASVVGYLTHSSSHGHPRLEKFLEKMQGVLQALIHFAPTASEEYESLQGLMSTKRDLSPQAMEDVLRSQVATRREAIARAVADEMRRSGVTADFGAGVDTAKGLEPVPTDAAQVRALLDPDRPDGDGKSLRAAGTTVPGVFRFIGSMLQERWMNLRAFRRGFEPAGIGAAFGAMVDFDHWYRVPALSPLPDQVRLHSLLSLFSDGYMLPLVAYNPWSDIEDNGATLALLTDAVEHHGFIGAKIYPPIGFRPARNAAHPAGSKWCWPDPDRLNERLGKFFSECARLGIPVLAHANATQGRDGEQDLYSEPQGWANLIADLAGRKQVPLLDLGHFGGDGSDGEGKAADDWPVGFAKLMDDGGGKGVYGDLGYWSGLRTCGTGDKACATALARLDAARSAFPRLGERLMYGSDWFMMIKEVAWKEWPDDIAAALQGRGFDLGRLFRANAIDCYGLAPGGANRMRVERFLGRAPSWLA